jgi:nucleoside-diphosphate-sugar epimerase
MAKKILVTGGSGNLARYVSPYLKEKGYLVTNFDQTPPAAGSECARWWPHPATSCSASGSA